MDLSWQIAFGVANFALTLIVLGVTALRKNAAEHENTGLRLPRLESDMKIVRSAVHEIRNELGKVVGKAELCQRDIDRLERSTGECVRRIDELYTQFME